MRPLRKDPSLRNHILHDALICQALSTQPRTLTTHHKDWSANFAGNTKACHIDPSRPGFMYQWVPKLLHLSNLDDNQVDSIITKGQQELFRGILWIADPSKDSVEKLSSYSALILITDWDGRALRPPKGKVQHRFLKIYFFVIDSFQQTIPSNGSKTETIRIHEHWEAAMPRNPTRLNFKAIEPFLLRFPSDTSYWRLKDSLEIGAIINFEGERRTRQLCPPSPNYYHHGTEDTRLKDFKKGFRTKDFAVTLQSLENLPLFNPWLAQVYSTVKKISGKARAVNNHSRNGPESTNFHSIRFEQDKWWSFEDACRALRALGRNTLAMQFDLVSAYKLLWLALQEYHLHCEAVPAAPNLLKTLGRTAFSLCLNFGSSTSYDAFKCLALAFEHIARSVATKQAPDKSTFTVRFCDNLMIMVKPKLNGSPDWDLARSIYTRVETAFKQAQIPVHAETPELVWKWHGHIQDSPQMAAKMTEERQKYLITTASGWLSKSSISLKQAQSVHGLFQHAAQVTPAGKKFLLRMRKFLHVLHEREKESPRRSSAISKGFKADLRWWLTILQAESYKGIYLLRDDEWTKAEALGITISAPTDASLLARGFCFQNQHCAEPWSIKILRLAWKNKGFSLPFLEGIGVVDCLATFGHLFARRKIVLHCDSQTFVDAYNAENTKDELLAELIRQIHFIETIHNFTVRLLHIPGESNTKADPLSRLLIKQFEKDNPCSVRRPLKRWPSPPDWQEPPGPWPPEFSQRLESITERLKHTGYDFAQ